MTDYSSAREAEFLSTIERYLTDVRAMQQFLPHAAPPSKLESFMPALQGIEAHLSDLRQHCINNLKG
jgi:hypothetical protein